MRSAQKPKLSDPSILHLAVLYQPSPLWVVLCRFFLLVSVLSQTKSPDPLTVLTSPMAPSRTRMNPRVYCWIFLLGELYMNDIRRLSSLKIDDLPGEHSNCLPSLVCSPSELDFQRPLAVKYGSRVLNTDYCKEKILLFYA